MAFPDDIIPADDSCAICGAGLADEVVIQESADGKRIRLCLECAAGATIEYKTHATLGTSADTSPTSPSTPVARNLAAEPDPMEVTRELLIPMADLITLQGEMQGALERLAGSLERFATEFISDSLDRTATVESRLRGLEAELEKTRSRLREAESLLIGIGGTPADDMGSTGSVAGGQPLTNTSIDTDSPPPVFVQATTSPILPPEDTGPLSKTLGQGGNTLGTTPVLGQQTTGGWSRYGVSPTAPAPSPSAPHFSIEDVRATQKYFNEGPFIERMQAVNNSLGKPNVNLSRLAGVEPRVLVTVFWDIVWYQYLVDLSHDTPDKDRVSLFREGMELGELNDCFKEKNASFNDGGRIDASELEVQLLSDPTVLITEMTPDEEKALEDATEEIWNQHIAPEFKWDD
ncbi:MAG: hypothetical protein ACOX8V_07865 [Thermoleophilia bacterium]|jgi:hypothetical protein